jgi:hypothetical protein
LIRAVHCGRYQRRDAEAGCREARDGPGHRRKRQRRTHSRGRYEPAGPCHRALAEAVDEPVTDHAADEHESDERDIPEGRHGPWCTEAVAQIQSGPRTS